MLKRIEGIFRDGKIELVEDPPDKQGVSRVIVTSLAPGDISLQSRGIDEEHAAALRRRLATFAEDWDSPEMDIYNDYEAARATL